MSAAITPTSSTNFQKQVEPDSNSRTALYYRVLPPGEFNSMITHPLAAVYCESFVMTAVAVSL